MPFNIGLSGLNAASADLEVTGNNIANAGTVGFKESRAEFADVYSSAYGDICNTNIGSGVRLASVTQQFNQGNIEFTENALDLGINGEGFFVINDNGEQLYTRSGAFQVDRDGYMVNNAGQRLQVFPPLEEGASDPSFNTGALEDLQLDFGDNAPRPTSEVSLSMNLSSEENQILDPLGAPVLFDATDPDTYNYSTSLTIYDSLGAPHTATFYYAKAADPLAWDLYIGVEGADTSPAIPITFDANGELATLDGLAVDPPATPASYDLMLTIPPGTGTGGLFGEMDPVIDPLDPATRLPVTFDLSGLTQYGDRYSVSDINQDGYTTGRLAGFNVSPEGVVFGRYTNGQSIALGQVAMANFSNPQGLQQLGNNNWAESFGSGDPVIGVAGTSNFGDIQSGGLEASNVDLAEELVHLIVAQRNFQANAQTISTADQITQTIINIR